MKLVAAKDSGFTIQELLLPNIRNHERAADCDHHGTFVQIPPQYKHLALLTIIRDPVDLVWSNFDFGYWKRDASVDFPKAVSNVREYLRWQDRQISRRLGQKLDGIDQLSYFAVQFVQMYAKLPSDLLRKIANDGIDTIDVSVEFPAIDILRQRFLTEDLQAFLRPKVEDPDVLQLVSSMPWSNVSTHRTSEPMRRNWKEVEEYAQKKLSLLYSVYDYWERFR